MRRLALASLIALLGASCAGRMAFKRGEDAFQRNQVDQAVQYYMRALQSEPENVRYRFALGRSLISASNYHLQLAKDMLDAGDTRAALYEFDKALEFGPNNNEARRQKEILLKRIAEEKKRLDEKSDLQMLKQKVALSESERAPKLHPEKEPFNLKLGETDLSMILRAIQSLSGIRILFDKDFKSQKLAVDLERVYFKEALEKILMQTRHFYKVIDERTIIVVPDDPKKRLEYNELVMRTFFLSNADLKQIEKSLKELAVVKTVSLNESLNAITVRDTPEKVAVAEKLIQTLDKARAELLIDVEILEVNRRRMQSYGIELSQYYVGETLFPWPVTDYTKIRPGAPIRGNVLKHLNSSDFFFTLPSVAYKLMQEDGDTKVKAKPQLRVLDLEKVSVLLGDSVPILQTSFVPNYGTSETDPLRQNPINSYTWKDVGIKIDLSPRVHHDGWITLNLEFVLTFLTSGGTAIAPPTIGTRNVKSVIRLHDNETGILAGLLRDNERRSLRGLPGLASVPILREIFSSNEKEISQTDIILTITPRIIKFPDINEEDLRSYYVGTEENLGLKERLPPSPFPATEPIDVVMPPAEPAQQTQPAAAVEQPPQPIVPDVAPAEEEPEPPEAVPVATTDAEASSRARLSLIREITGPVAIGQTFAAELVVENLAELQMLEGELQYPREILHVERVEIGSFVRSRGGDIKPGIDNQAGKLRLSIVLGGMASGVRRETLVIVYFKAVGNGQATVEPTEMHLYDPRLGEPPFDFPAFLVSVGGADAR